MLTSQLSTTIDREIFLLIAIRKKVCSKVLEYTAATEFFQTTRLFSLFLLGVPSICTKY